MPFSLWLTDAPLLLASGSATRRAILEAAGVPVTVQAADLDERAVEEPLRAAGASPAAIATHLARAKAMLVAGAHPDRLVLGADQTLGLGAELFSKPRTIDAARHHLRALSGRTHTLHSALCLVSGGTVIFEAVAEARLSMRALSDVFIEAYLKAEGDAVCASVGAYRLEGMGAHLFTQVDGDHTTVLGLPILTLLPALRQFGYLLD